MMNPMELIKHRKSIRTYTEESLRPEDRERILAYVQTVGNPYDLPIEYRILNVEEHGLSSPVIVGADTYIAGKMKRSPHAEEAFGYSFEKLVLYADSLGIGTVWIGGTMDRNAFERAMDKAEDEVVPCVSPLGYPAKKRSLRETMMRKGIKADSRFSFEELFFEKTFDTPLTPETAFDLSDVLEMVRWSPSAVNKQPWRVLVDGQMVHFYEKRSKGYVDDTGWDMQKIDMGIALCHFEMGIEDMGKRAVFALNDPGIELPEDMEYIASYHVS